MKTIINSPAKVLKAIKAFFYPCKKDREPMIQKGFAFAD